MAEETAALTGEQKKAIADKLNQLWQGAKQCPVCGQAQWTVGDHLVTPTTLGPNNSVMLGGLSYPQVMVISNACGYTMFFNAIVLGVVPSVADNVPPLDGQSKEAANAKP